MKRAAKGALPGRFMEVSRIIRAQKMDQCELLRESVGR